MAVLQRGQIRDSQQNLEDLRVILRKQLDVSRDLRSWAYKAHLAAQDVDQSGEFVDLGLAQYPFDSGDAPILANRSCRKRAGPGKSSLIRKLTRSNSGKSNTSPIDAAVLSNARFITAGAV
jgi:hypothetical protein